MDLRAIIFSWQWKHVFALHGLENNEGNQGRKGLSAGFNYFGPLVF